MVSKQYWSGSSEKSQNYQASIQCWAIIGPPAKRHLNGVRWRAGDGPLIVLFGLSLPSSTKKSCQSWTPLTKLSGSAHELGHEFELSEELFENKKWKLSLVFCVNS